MRSRIPMLGLPPLPALAAALLLGAAPAAAAECPAGAGGATASQQGQTAKERSGAATTEESQVTPGQGGTTTGQGGAVTEQPGTATAEAAGTPDSGEISGADEQAIKTLLTNQGYAEVSSIKDCGSYYLVEATESGKNVVLQVDLATGRINTM